MCVCVCVSVRALVRQDGWSDNSLLGCRLSHFLKASCLSANEQEMVSSSECCVACVLQEISEKMRVHTLSSKEEMANI